MPLEQLYTKSPMEEYAALPFGIRWGMGMDEFQGYESRQKERDALIQRFNRQAVEKYNPALIEQQNLANQQQQYMMPTYQAQGMEAKGKMNTPNYYGAKAESELVGFGAKLAEDKNKIKAAEADAPFIKPIAEAKRQSELAYAKLTSTRNTISSFDGTPEEAIEFIQTKLPKSATYWVKMIQDKGLEPARAMMLSHLDNQIEHTIQGILKADPTHRMKIAEQASNPKGSINNAELALMAAGGDPKKALELLNAQGNTSEAAVVQVARAYAAAEHRTNITAADLDKARTQIIAPSVKQTTTNLQVGPNGLPVKVETAVSGPGGGQAPKGKPPVLPPGATLK